MPKRKHPKPDEVIRAGPLQIARFGKNIIWQANWDEEEYRTFQKRLIDRYPGVIQEIDSIVTKIIDLVKFFPPEKLLQRAWGEMAVAHLRVQSEVEIDSEKALLLRMVDYVQSIIAAVSPAQDLRPEVSDEEWITLRSLVKDLFAKVNYEYQICRTAVRKASPEFDEAANDLEFKAQLYWCNVRGTRYLVHEKEHLEDLLLPHSEVLIELFGLTGAQFVEEIMKVQHALTRGVFEAGNELGKFQEATAAAVEAKLSSGNADEADLPQLFADVIRENGWEGWRDSVFGRFLGLDLFDLQKVTTLPVKLLDELSWPQGGDREFLANGELRGWPLRIWPIFKRPFIRLDDSYYCFDLYNLLDNLYRVMQKTICRLKPGYNNEWNKIQNHISERLPFKYMEKLLPGAEIYQSVHYAARSSGSRRLEWCEADGLLIYDDHLFIVEVRAGAFTYTSPAIDFPAYIDSLRNLIMKPAEQGSRFLKYLRSEKEVPICNAARNEIAKLSYRNFRCITICIVTLDPFTEIAAQIQHLKKIGLDLGGDPTWALSIDDLRVYADIFENPLVFLHFVEQRTAAFYSEIIQSDDEMDHIGLYLEHNRYADYAKEMVARTGAKLQLLGYRAEIDKFFSDKLQDSAFTRPLEQQLPARVKEIIGFLAASGKPRRARIASFLLDIGGEWRDRLSSIIDSELSDQEVRKKARGISTYGDVKLTLFCWHMKYAPRDEVDAFEHAETVALGDADGTRTLLELIYSEGGRLVDVIWRGVTTLALSENERQRLRQKSNTLKERRLTISARGGKIGRNEMCPCGSGKKYKRCCLKSASAR